MVMQRYATAVRECYAGRDDVADQHARARELRAWLESLALPTAIRHELAEPISALEEAFADLLRAPGLHGRRRRGPCPGD